MEALRQKYLTIDTRALGVGRVALALVLLLDLFRRIPFATLWYSNLGLLPNHTVLWRPPFPHAFSLFFTASRPGEAVVGFGLCAVAYGMLLVGWRTRLAQMTSLLAVLSLHGRLLFIQNSGDVVLVELCVWTLFLPLGRRCSIDAFRAGDDGRPPDQTPVVSWAALALVVQLAVIYLFNALQKNGQTWREGTAVHYVLHYENVVTQLGVWLRGWITPGQSHLLTWSTRAVEALLPVLLMTPVAQRSARRLAIALIVALHAGFALFLNLGIFVPAMLVFVPFLLPAVDWDRLERIWRRTRLAERIRAAALRLARSGPAPLASDQRWRRPREAAIVALMAIAGCGALVDNPAVTRVSPAAEPRAVNAVRTYLQMFQSWGMFAPDVPTTEGTIAVDAVTAGGRHVDPLNEALSPRHPWLGDTIPAALGNNGFAAAYLVRLPTRPDYFTALGEWLLRYPERTGHEADRLVSFRVLALQQDDPPPGERLPRNPRTTLLFRYPN